MANDDRADELEQLPAGGGTGRQGGQTSEDLKRGAGVTGGPHLVEEKHRHQPNEGEGSGTTGG